MDSLDLQVLAQARDWFLQGSRVWLVTVIETWGSAPRPPGALLALRDDGCIVGSVSGGCVEDDLIDRLRHGERLDGPSLVSYGNTKAEADAPGGERGLMRPPTCTTRSLSRGARDPSAVFLRHRCALPIFCTPLLSANARRPAAR